MRRCLSCAPIPSRWRSTASSAHVSVQLDARMGENLPSLAAERPADHRRRLGSMTGLKVVARGRLFQRRLPRRRLAEPSDAHRAQKRAASGRLRPLPAGPARPQRRGGAGAAAEDPRLDEYAAATGARRGRARAEIDDVLGKHVEGWSLQRLGVLERAILRLAAYELIWGTRSTLGRSHRRGGRTWPSASARTKPGRWSTGCSGLWPAAVRRRGGRRDDGQRRSRLIDAARRCRTTCGRWTPTRFGRWRPRSARRSSRRSPRTAGTWGPAWEWSS